MKNGCNQRTWIPTLIRVREHTRAEHEAIERSLGLMSDTLTHQAYQRTLKQFYGFWRPVETGLRHTVWLPETGIDLAGRATAPLLALDLRALGRDEPADVPLCDELPFMASVPAKRPPE